MKKTMGYSFVVTRRRSGGRADKLAQRSVPPQNPCPPGQQGGHYKPLLEPELKAIYDTALRLLRDLGLGEVPDRLATDLTRAGAEMGDDGRVRFPNALVEDAIAKAAKKFVLHGRDEDRSIEVGGGAVHFVSLPMSPMCSNWM